MRNALPLSFFVLLAGASAAAPALALDCAKATTPVDTAICADPAANATDDAMTKAYDALALKLSPQEKTALLTSQRRWLKRRGFICSAKDAAAMTACLTDQTDQRRAYLAGEPDSGPGAAQAFTPVLVQHVGQPYQYDIDVNAVKFADPQLAGEKLFNAKVEALLKKVPKIDQTGFRQNMVYSYDLDVSATFASPELVSAHVEIYDFSGGAHGNTTTSNFTIDLDAGKELTFVDLFKADAKPALDKECLAEIARQKHEKVPDGPFDVVSADEQKKTIDQSVGDLTRWSLDATGAKITFDPYALGAYFEGSYACDFSAEQLRPLLKLNYLAETSAPQAEP